MAKITEWAEDLPPRCPPEDAVEPDNNPFYRLVGNNPPQETDFWSQRKLYPEKTFHANECITRACSLLTSYERCLELSKLPVQQGKKIFKIVLPRHSGLIKKTGRDVAHYSWWRAKAFDPITACVECDL